MVQTAGSVLVESRTVAVLEVVVTRHATLVNGQLFSPIVG